MRPLGGGEEKDGTGRPGSQLLWRNGTPEKWRLTTSAPYNLTQSEPRWPTLERAPLRELAEKWGLDPDAGLASRGAGRPRGNAGEVPGMSQQAPENMLQSLSTGTGMSLETLYSGVPRQTLHLEGLDAPPRHRLDDLMARLSARPMHPASVRLRLALPGA
nr:uncharacterized protein CTRU02_12978 [Colletotrichum truncatum]KAF6783962.1 hypothetical protein CTRU02_12978 [Colletotrichum truncatum]